MVEKKHQPISKRTPVKKAAQKPQKPASSKKSSSSVKPKKETVSTNNQQTAQSETWHKDFERIRGWLKNWWEHGLGDEIHEPVRKKQNKTGIRLNTRRLRPKARPRPSISTVSGIHLKGKEEHRCPYCLEEVIKNDPRGVKICPICRTHHHADCWAVTGACQVPHYHE